MSKQMSSEEEAFEYLRELIDLSQKQVQLQTAILKRLESIGRKLPEASDEYVNVPIKGTINC